MKNNKEYFFIIGAQKAGTTTIYDLFNFTNEVYAPAQYKDFHIFNDVTKYDNHIKKLQKTDIKKILHAGVNYMTNFETILSINKLFPDAKYIIILRNPVKRAISAYNYIKRMGLENRAINKAFEEELASPSPLIDFDKSYLNHGLYYEQIKSNVLGNISKDKLGLFFYEDVFKNDTIHIEEILDFMQVPSFNFPNNFSKNVGGSAKYHWLNKFVYKNSTIKHLIAQNVPTGIRGKLKRYIFELNRSNKKKSDIIISPAIIEKITEFYINDIIKLSELTKRDLNELWLNK